MQNKDDADVLATEDRFLGALTQNDLDHLRKILADDFVMIDALSGAETPRADFLNALSSGALKFPSIKREGPRVRFYETTALVTGSALLTVQMAGHTLTVSSRYTHVYVEQEGRWRLASAQTTPIMQKG